MNLIKPAGLKAGDTIGLIALSGIIEDKLKVERAVEYFNSLGYNVVLSENIYDTNRYLAGSDEIKISELHRFFKDDSIKAVICVRGGYGAIRLINKIDYNVIRTHPKLFCGFSDVTALSLMMLKRAGLITFSAPMVMSDFGLEKRSDFTMDNFFNVVTSGREIKLKNEDKIYKNGSAEGIFWGGNLATIVSLCGQDFIPDEPFIFFVEDLNEPVYKIDKMFTQLFNIPEFKKNIRAVILGEFLNSENQVWLDDLFQEIALMHDIPVVSGYKITHGYDKLTLPIGAYASLIDGELFIK